MEYFGSAFHISIVAPIKKCFLRITHTNELLYAVFDALIPNRLTQLRQKAMGSEGRGRGKKQKSQKYLFKK